MALPEEGQTRNIRNIILEQNISWRNRFLKPPTDLQQPTLMEAFDGIDFGIIIPTTLTVEYLQDKWGPDCLTRITDVSIDTKGGIEPGLVSVSLRLQQPETEDTMLGSISIMTLTSISVQMVSQKVLTIFGSKRPVYSWGGEECTLFSELQIIDIQTKNDERLISLRLQSSIVCMMINAGLERMFKSGGTTLISGMQVKPFGKPL